MSRVLFKMTIGKLKSLSTYFSKTDNTHRNVCQSVSDSDFQLVYNSGRLKLQQARLNYWKITETQVYPQNFNPPD